MLILEKKRRATLLKKRPWHRCFLVNFAKFLRTPFFTQHLWATDSEVSKIDKSSVSVSTVKS